MKVRVSLLAGFVLLGVFSTRGHAAITPFGAITPNAADAEIDNNNAIPTPTTTVTQLGNYAVRVGEEFAPGGACYVMPFQLPTLDPGASFATADLRIQLLGIAGTPANADLYGLRVSTSPIVLTSDYYQGLLDTNSTLIQQSYLTALSPVRTDANTGPFVDSNNTTANAAFVSFLNTAYALGANAGQYVFLRINYDLPVIPGGNNAYSPLTADAGGANEKPLLTFAEGSVPEPTTVAFSTVLVIAGLLRRRPRPVSSL